MVLPKNLYLDLQIFAGFAALALFILHFLCSGIYKMMHFYMYFFQFIQYIIFIIFRKLYH